MAESIGRVTIAHSVLHEIVRLTTLNVPGVARLGVRPGLRRGGDGVHVDVIDDRAEVDVYVVTGPDASMRDTAHAIQSEVARAMKEIVGMDVSNVNVYIQDVDVSSAQ